MRSYDVTLTLRPGMFVYPGEPGPELKPLKRIADGANANVSELSLGLHNGTHVDAPWHFLDAGATVERLSLEVLCGPARLVAIHDPKRITVAELERARLDGVSRVLFRTRNSELWNKPEFDKDFVALDPDAASWLVERGVRLVGVDYLSAEAFKAEGAPVHHILLGAGVVIVEGLDLREPPPGDYELLCLPLKLHGADGAPARVVLRPLQTEERAA